MAEHTDADVDLMARADFEAQWPGRDWDAVPAGEADEYRADARAGLSALSAAGRDHTAGVAEGRRRERESVVAYLREFVGHLSARDIEQGRHLEGRPPLPTVDEIDEAARRRYLERIEGHTDEP